MAQRIYFNGICRVQLPNGGFALDECLGFDPVDRLSFKKESDGQPVEAYWCCTMRGAAGLSYVNQNQCVKVDGNYKFINYFDCSVIDEDVVIYVKSYYPYEGKIMLYINNPNNKEIKLNLFVPKNATNVKCSKNSFDNEINFRNGFITLDVSEIKSEVSLCFDISRECARCIACNYGKRC